METSINPALSAWLKSWETEILWAQVLIRRTSSGYSLTHQNDSTTDPAALKSVNEEGLLQMVQFSKGVFRPLRSAPDLERGWKFEAANPTRLGRGLDILYPGSIPDWHALYCRGLKATDYRTYTNRQTGMYRLTQKLSDDLVVTTAHACCSPRFCLKRRVWTAPGLQPDDGTVKSSIPCMEPCPLMLELARKAMRIAQADQGSISLCQEDRDVLVELLGGALNNSDPNLRVADFSNAMNPRRLALLMEKLKSLDLDGKNF